MNTANGENEVGNDQDEDIKLNKNVVEKEIKNRKNENSDTISTKKGEDESKDEVSNENEGICNEKNDAIDLTITKKSLRQRNRVPHTTPHSDSPVLPKKVATHTSSIQSFFSDLIMEIKMLEGHYQDVCSVDLSSDYVVSGGRDTAIKLWSASSAEELKSVGGHTGTVTGVRFMKDKKFETYPKVVSGSYDCSIRTWDLENGTSLKCIYVYSPVVCLDYLDGKVAIGTEGGKVEVYNIDTGEQVLSVSAYEDAISAVKLLPDDKVASGSTDGILKIFDISITQLEPVFTLDPSQISIKGVSQVEDECTKPHNLLLSRISCITTWRDLVIYGDEGYNIKVLDYKKGEITKVRNNLQEFSPTESIYVSSVDGHDYLFSVGSDVDLGDAYINIRSLPDLKYFGTIRDTHSSTGPITSFCIQEVESCIRFVSGGQQLRVWEQISRRAKKRKSSSEEDCLIPCKFICNYTEARESEPDTDSDESEQSKSISEESVSVNESSEARSWCAIL